MQETLLVQPDTAFIHDVMASGGRDLKKCMQCGTCSAVCGLAPDDLAFPRKQMLEAQWGLKDKLIGDPAIWLCHNCGDCMTYCPRGARPGDVFGALRQAAIEHFAWPRFLAKMAGSPWALPALLVLPGLVFLAIARWAPKPAPTPSPEFAAVFPIPVLETLFFAISGAVLVIFSLGLIRFLKALKASGAFGGIVPAALIGALVEIMTHERFSKCSTNRNRRFGHLLTFWGFIGLAVTGTAVGIGTMVGMMHTPLPLTSPWKIFANLSAGVILIGTLLLLADRIKDPLIGVAATGTAVGIGSMAGIMITPLVLASPQKILATGAAAAVLIVSVALFVNRAQDPGQRTSNTYFDWFFLLTLTGVVLTGILSEGLRLAQAGRVMYGVYFVHLVLIFSLFLYAPYSKFAHFVYRTVAMAAVKGKSGNRG